MTGCGTITMMLKFFFLQKTAYWTKIGNSLSKAIIVSVLEGVN